MSIDTTGTIPERVERDSTTPEKAAPAEPLTPRAEEPVTPKKAPKKKATKKAAPAKKAPAKKALPKKAPAKKAPAKKAPAKKAPVKKALSKKVTKSKRPTGKKRGRVWPVVPFTVYVQVRTNKPKALKAALDKVLKTYAEKAPRKKRAKKS